MARGQMQREQGVAVGREWAGRRSTVGADELQSQVFRVSRTHRVEQARHSKGCCQGWGKGKHWVGEPGISISSMEPWGR